jgi:SAM-dependent methyltransferase
MAADSWEERYTAAGNLFGEQPSELLVENQSRLQRGTRALAVGDGEGRNGVWLAEHGLIVDSLDISPTALARAEALALRRRVSVTTICTDMLAWQWPDASYDLIVAIFVHLPHNERGEVHRHMRAALRPGGLLLIEAFHLDQLGMESGGPPRADLLYTLEELREDFRDLEILSCKQVSTDVELAGVWQGKGAAVHFVARSPTAP